MKRFLIVLSAFAAVLAFGSCQKEGVLVPAGEEVSVELSAVLPSRVETKAMSKAENVDAVYYEVWDENWTRRLFPSQGAQPLSARVVGKQASIELTLVRGLTYNMIFWAQNSAFDGYDVSDLRNVKVDYSKFKGNQDSYDAFYSVDTLKVGKVFKETVELTRPFAQLNFGASEMSTDLGPIVLTGSTVQVSHLATVFDTRLGVGVQQQNDVVFAADGIATSEKLETNGGQYSWIAMDYMLVMDKKDAATVTSSFYIDGLTKPVTHKLHQVPLEMNHRTNIIGDLFTSNAQLTVKIEDAFQKDDEVIEINNL